MTQGELSESALDLLLTDIIVWPVRVLHRRPPRPQRAGRRCPDRCSTSHRQHLGQLEGSSVGSGR